MIQTSDIDYKLRQALDAEQMIDVSQVKDRHVKALPTGVKANCLFISERLQASGIEDDPVARLKRAAKLSQVIR